MKKVVRLTESDLIKLVKRVIKEQEDVPGIVEFNNRMVYLKGAESSVVQRVLNNLPKTVKFVAIRESENADFSDIDMCSFPELLSLTLIGTPNNFLDNVSCEIYEIDDSIYEFIRDSE